MASNPFNALMDPQQLGASIQNAFQYGTQQRQQAETQRALGAYAQNMSPETAANVSRHDPRTGIQLQKFEVDRAELARKAQEAENEKMVTIAAINGDPTARQKLAYYNAPFYIQLQDRDKKAVDATMDAIAQQAFTILQQPPEQQGPMLQQALGALQAQGLDTSQFALTGDPAGDLRAALAMTGKLEAWEKFAQPNYTPIGEAGLAGFQFGVPIQQGGQPQNFGVQGGQPQSAPQQQANPQVTQILRNSTASRLITPEEAQIVQAELGPNGQAAFQGWLQQNGVVIGKQLNGQTFYLVNGKWYDNPEGR